VDRLDGADCDTGSHLAGGGDEVCDVQAHCTWGNSRFAAVRRSHEDVEQCAASAEGAFETNGERVANDPAASQERISSFTLAASSQAIIAGVDGPDRLADFNVFSGALATPQAEGRLGWFSRPTQLIPIQEVQPPAFSAVGSHFATEEVSTAHQERA
jgi:hypothetical protein